MIRRADPVDPSATPDLDCPERLAAPGATAKGALLPLMERIDDHNPMRGLLAVQAECERRITMEADRLFDTTPACVLVQELARQWAEAEGMTERATFGRFDLGRSPPVVEEVELYPADFPRGAR